MLTNTLATVPSSELTARLYELRGAERRLLVELLVYLGEVDRRRLHAELGFSSLFVFLSQHLGYSSSAAYRRSTAARLVARFPVVAEYLGDGRLSLTTLVELRHVLDEARLEELLARAAGRSEDEVKRLVAALAPRPAVPDSLRRKPVRATTTESASTGSVLTGNAPSDTASAGNASADNASAGIASTGNASTGTASAGNASADNASAGIASTGNASTGTASTGTASTGTASTGTASTGTASTGTAPSDNAPTGIASTGTAPSDTASTGIAPETRTCAPAAGPPPRARVAPLSATQHLLRATVSSEFVRDLEEVRAALSHKLPGGSLEAVLHECLRVTLAACHKRRRGAGSARSAPADDRAAVPAPANDQVDRTAAPAAANDGLDRAAVPASANDQVDRAAAPAAANGDLDRTVAPAAANDNLEAPPAGATSRYIPAAVRDEVWRRDGGRCGFVGRGGHVCGSTFQIEVHHLQAFARGGAATADGLALRCKVHNLLEAERDFGREHVERAIARARHEQGRRGPRQARLL